MNGFKYFYAHNEIDKINHLYDLELTLTSVNKITNGIVGELIPEYKFSAKHCINKDMIDNKFIDIDVTVPFFIFEVKSTKCEPYKMGAEIVWSKLDPEGNVSIDLHEIKKKDKDYNHIQLNTASFKEKTIGQFFNFDRKMSNKDECMDERLFNSQNRIRITLNYKWTISKNNTEHQKRLKPYNDAVTYLMTGKKIQSLLGNLSEFNTYQDELAKKVNENIKKTDLHTQLISVKDDIDTLSLSEDEEELMYKDEKENIKRRFTLNEEALEALRRNMINNNLSIPFVDETAVVNPEECLLPSEPVNATDIEKFENQLLKAQQPSHELEQQEYFNELPELKKQVGNI